ncbi:protein-methionine-sulfoxide reductase catalytic subunit MsrP [Paracoccus fistulariae]|uniref:Protein-methionine-sulfoxide reductase catalytic subunit MsrP n=1 Tax=Paracoccus fistulariae TaxID=658446 RepID=A0ABY7SJI4_9RHOB|nr:protein-methionine-sulfoxide reductase catalytic subunit MsrP [Paracoccus fistulariae]MDB6182897.1 protein-methionine-sulfoxide reductase catalytic subunit MsrP [Paracoccus fistulariae]WCR06096.1 protein-methionine-sulfoxide reductase catalytic subunit MsrP [Paracoccus fistulariae]
MKLNWSDVTPKHLWLNRRNFIAGGAALAASPALALSGRPSPFSTSEKPNTLEEITNYNNFYEFGTGKTDPAKNAGAMTTDPWSVEIGGLVDRPGSYGVEDLAPDNALEERIYRLRCVEAWSMVIPWIGVPLASVLEKVGVQSGAKYVAFQTLLRPEEMSGQRFPSIRWPYVEGLRLDEAMHPLTILATGLYSDPLPNQNGAPIRLVVPWKYGFKSIKSIVRITLTDQQPPTSWNELQPSEYGFYANVNPNVSHPRWSQATERRIGAGLFGGREETLMFNGYADQVASLYSGMDLAQNY